MYEIDLKTAQNAFRGTSFYSEERGARFVKDVREHLEWLTEWANQWRTDDNGEQIDEAITYYSAKYVEKANAYLYAHTRCISSFIAGPSNFPVARAEKANASADKRLLEWIEWSKKQQYRIRKQFDPKLASQVISADDEDAIAQLQAKLERLRQFQELIKAANRICRKKNLTDEDVVKELANLGLSDKLIYEAMHPSWGPRGFRPYVLSNNNANIHRIENRIKALEYEAARREATPSEYEINGVQVEEDDGDNRLKLYFDGKPTQAIIDALKRRGFHWSPRQKCWMRQLNENARRAMREVLSMVEVQE